jgi:Anti-sigma factor NepR
VRDTPKPTGPQPHIAEFRTPRDGRRRVVRAVGNGLRVMYADVLKESLPRRITDLLRRLKGKQ